MYPDPYKALVEEEPENLCPGGSAIVSPMGELLAGPLFDQAGALRAELDLESIIPSKMDFDVNGHYSRKDIFRLHVEGQPETGLEEESPDE
jgi:nitrilase